jgi:adenine-specific DNA methylase
LRQHGAADGLANNNLQVDHVFTNESKISFQFDYFEAGPGSGAGTWASVANTAVSSLKKVLLERRGSPVRLRTASATALPMRDASVDVVITDPPYYDMIEYADASDLLYVWLKRALSDIEPDLFGPDAERPDGLQDKNEEIIVRRVHEPGRVRHDTEFYENMLAKSFVEARRVLKPNGHMVVVFGHSDPDAWKLLLGALHAAGFVVTSAWPSRTESANTGVASIKVTVTIGCRVAPVARPVGTTAQVDLQVSQAVAERVRQWDADGLALEDQLMASYGPAMEVYGRYARVLNPDGSSADLDRYLTLARRAVRDAMKLKVDELPLETFDAITRFSLFWLRAKGRAEVPKGEARFFAQADQLRLIDLRDRILTESGSGFRLRLDDAGAAHLGMSTFEVVRAMAYASRNGTEAVAAVIGWAGREANDPICGP